jgi:hypothetical protein
MAVTENYNVKVVIKGQAGLNKLNNSTVKIQKSMGGLGTAAKAAGAAIAALGVAKAVGGFIRAGQTVEELEIRLKTLLGSAEEGAKAFELMNDFAGRVPFTLEAIAAASNNLAVVSADAEELQENLDLTANIAAAFGLDIQTAGEQIQRALSSGIASADIFRERGVSAFAGFEAGVSHSAEETRKQLFKVFGKGGSGAGAIDEFADSLTGQISMLQDAFFRFQVAVSEGFFQELKGQFGDLQTFLAENSEEIDDFGRSLGTGLAVGLEAIGNTAKFVKDNIDLIVAAFAALAALKLAATLLNIARGLGSILIVTRSLAAMTGVGLGLVAASVAAGAFAFKEMNDVLDDFEKKMEDAAAATKAMEGHMTDAQRKFGGMIPPIKETSEAVEELDQDLIDLEEELLGGGLGGAFDKVFKPLPGDIEDATVELYELGTGFNEVEFAVDTLNGVMDTFSQGVGDAFADAIVDGKSFKDSMEALGKTILKSVISALVQIAIQFFIVKPLMERLGLALNPLLDKEKAITKELLKQLAIRTALFVVTGGSSAAIPGMANGGPVAGGRPYIVGERGPELFVPGQSGAIVPNEELGASGGGEVNVNFNISTIDAAGFDDLLLARRGVISGIINEGMNRQGRRALV